MKGVIFCVLLIVALPVFSQDRGGVDSLQNLLHTGLTDTERVDVLNLLCWKLQYNDTRRSIAYGEKALALSRKLQYKQGLTTAYSNLGSVCDNISDYDRALEYYGTAMELNKENGNRKGLANIYNSVGVVYQNKGELALALDNYLKALKIRQELNYKPGISDCYNNIGIIHLMQGDYENAIENFLKSLETDKEIGDKKGVADSYINLGYLYEYHGDMEKALEFHNRALNAYSKLGDKQGMADAYNGIGDYYNNKSDYLRAVEYHEKAVALQDEIGDKKGLTYSFYSLGNAYAHLQRRSAALAYIERSIIMAKEIGAKRELEEAYEKSAEVSALLKDYKKAYAFSLLRLDLRDSILGAEKAAKIAELESRYEMQIQRDKIKLLSAQNLLKDISLRKKQLTIYAVMGSAVLLLLLAVAIYKGYRQKQKANILLSVKNQEITDSITYARRIQDAMLPISGEWEKLLPRSFVYYKPKDIVSGDFYWIEGREGKVYFSCVDCTGHGVPGAFLSIVGYNGLNQAVHEYGLSQPADILNHLNENIWKSLRESGSDYARDGMDIAFCCLDKKNMTLQYAGAYNPLYLINPGRKAWPKMGRKFEDDMPGVEIRADSIVIGLETGAFTNHEIALEKGDRIYLFSDGFADQFGGPKGKKFKYKQFKKLLCSIYQEPMAAQSQILDKTFNSWRGELKQLDDVCVLGVEV